jgi:hypothetical protein
MFALPSFKYHPYQKHHQEENEARPKYMQLFHCLHVQPKNPRVGWGLPVVAAPVTDAPNVGTDELATLAMRIVEITIAATKITVITFMSGAPFYTHPC